MQFYDFNEVGVITKRRPRDMYLQYFEYMVNKKKYIDLIPFTVAEYGISPKISELPDIFRSVSYDKNLRDEAETVFNSNVFLFLGRSAFKCPSRLATTLVHELTHVRQATLLKHCKVTNAFAKRGTPQQAMDEVLAYFMEYQARNHTLIPDKEKRDVQKELIYWMQELKSFSNTAYKKWDKEHQYAVFEKKDKIN